MAHGRLAGALGLSGAAGGGEHGELVHDGGSGALLGISLMGLVVLVMVVSGVLAWAREPATAGRAVGALLELSAFLAVAAFAEELLLRGYPLQVIAEALGGPAAVVLTAVVFAGLHALNPHVSPLALVNIALAGILLGAALWRTMSLWFVTGIHFGWNWTMGVAADLPVSGVDDAVPGFSLDTPGIEAVLSGSSSLTGGSFGPEASWVVTGVTLAGIVWVTTRRRPGPALRVLALRPPAARRSTGRRGYDGERDRPRLLDGWPRCADGRRRCGGPGGRHGDDRAQPPEAGQEGEDLRR
jgi:membrane protease YdiL (CAAX protease family)